MFRIKFFFFKNLNYNKPLFFKFYPYYYQILIFKIFSENTKFNSFLLFNCNQFYSHKSYSNIFFFNFFFNKYLTKKIKSNSFFFFNFLNFNLVDSNKYLHWLLVNFKKNSSFNLSNLIIDSSLIKSILYCLISKDSVFFVNLLKHIMENMYYKNHKKFLVSLKYIFFFLFKYMKGFLSINGLKFSIKGKISLGGNSKKKSMSFNLGSFSLNRKNFLIVFSKNNINTLSGSLGLFFFIFF